MVSRQAKLFVHVFIIEDDCIMWFETMKFVCLVAIYICLKINLNLIYIARFNLIPQLLMMRVNGGCGENGFDDIFYQELSQIGKSYKLNYFKI